MSEPLTPEEEALAERLLGWWVDWREDHHSVEFWRYLARLIDAERAPRDGLRRAAQAVVGAEAISRDESIPYEVEAAIAALRLVLQREDGPA